MQTVAIVGASESKYSDTVVVVVQIGRARGTTQYTLNDVKCVKTCPCPRLIPFHYYFSVAFNILFRGTSFVPRTYIYP